MQAVNINPLVKPDCYRFQVDNTGQTFRFERQTAAVAIYVDGPAGTTVYVDLDGNNPAIPPVPDKQIRQTPKIIGAEGSYSADLKIMALGLRTDPGITATVRVEAYYQLEGA